MRPFVISHRGLCRAARRARRSGENTLAAFQAGIDALAALGMPPAIEFDVRQSSDSRLVVIHDATLRRTAGIPARVRRRTAWELAGFGVPLLEDVIDRFPQAELHVEIKERGIAEQVARLIQARRSAERIVVSSFLWRELAPFHGHVRVALTSAIPTGRLIRAARKAGAWAVHPDQRRTTAAFVRAAHADGLKVHTWTVNTPRSYARAGRLGVDAVFSDNPLLLGPEQDRVVF